MGSEENVFECFNNVYPAIRIEIGANIQQAHSLKYVYDKYYAAIPIAVDWKRVV